MAASPFLKIPREIRDQIYAYALFFPKGIRISIKPSGGKAVLTHQPRSHHPLGLALANSQLHQECAALFYSLNKFYIYPGPGENWGSVRPWLRQIGPSNRSALRSVDVDLGTWRVPYVQGAHYVIAKYEMAGQQQIVHHITSFRDAGLKCTFSINIKFSDHWGYNRIQLREVDFLEEMRLFAEDPKSTNFEQAEVKHLKLIGKASKDRKLDRHDVIDLLM